MSSMHLLSISRIFLEFDLCKLEFAVKVQAWLQRICELYLYFHYAETNIIKLKRETVIFFIEQLIVNKDLSNYIPTVMPF
jgi:hypothetical protein